MKKRIVLVCSILATFSLAAFTLLSKDHSTSDLDLVYKVDSRYWATITKKDLHEAASVLDIVPKKATDWWKVNFQTVMISLLLEDGESQSVGTSKMLSDEQLKLLRSTDYSTNFYIKARGTDMHPATGRIEDYAYYFTIIPEKEAQYEGGYDALIDYLKEGSKKETGIIQKDLLRPGQVRFTVTGKGTVRDVKLMSSSGYSSVDKTLIKLINSLPHNWKAATDEQGKKVHQELVFFFGLEGC